LASSRFCCTSQLAGFETFDGFADGSAIVTKFWIEHQETHKYSNANEILFYSISKCIGSTRKTFSSQK
jgi:hypothetical protein